MVGFILAHKTYLVNRFLNFFVSKRIALNKKTNRRDRFVIISSINGRVLRPAKQIVYGNIKIICEGDQRFIVRFPFPCLIAADAVLIHIQRHGQCYLRNMPPLSQFFQSENTASPLDIRIPKRYNQNIPFWYN